MWLFEGATSSTAEISLRNSQFQHIIRSTSPFLFAFLETKKFRTIIVRIKQINLSLINQKPGNYFFSCSVLKWVFLWRKNKTEFVKIKLQYSWCDKLLIWELDYIYCSYLFLSIALLETEATPAMKKRRKTCEHVAEGSNQNRITKCSWCVNIRIKKNLLLDHIFACFFFCYFRTYLEVFLIILYLY